MDNSIGKRLARLRNMSDSVIQPMWLAYAVLVLQYLGIRSSLIRDIPLEKKAQYHFSLAPDAFHRVCFHGCPFF